MVQRRFSTAKVPKAAISVSSKEGCGAATRTFVLESRFLHLIDICNIAQFVVSVKRESENPTISCGIFASITTYTKVKFLLTHCAKTIKFTPKRWQFGGFSVFSEHKILCFKFLLAAELNFLPASSVFRHTFFVS